MTTRKKSDKTANAQPKQEVVVQKSNSPLIFISHDTRDAELAEEFSNLLKSASAGGLKSFVSSDGILSVKIWKHKVNDCCHFWTVTEWRDIEAIKKFAGEDYELAKYYREDDGMLLEFEEKVQHYESYNRSV